MSDADPHRLDRFVQAQRDSYARALTELRNGRKTGHWMWFVFPQLAGLGSSPTARHYAITGIDEARAYRAHPVLGPRLVEAAGACLEHADLGAERLLGGIDAIKLRSSMTLFGRADPGEPMFGSVLAAFYAGRKDEATLRLLG